MSKYVVPKLVEITMVSGTFGAGEIVEGSRPNTNNDAIRFRLQIRIHKYGPYNNPNQVYKQNPYDPASTISSTYSSTTSILNVDTASLELQSASGFYGYITTGMKLIGQSSGAIATVSAIRLITDKAGSLLDLYSYQILQFLLHLHSTLVLRHLLYHLVLPINYLWIHR